MPHLYEQLRDARQRARLKQADLADAIGWTSHTQVSNVESARRSTTIDVAEQWAALCGYEVILVPLRDDDPTGAEALVRATENPQALDLIARVARLTRHPRRFWAHLIDHVAHEERLAQAAAERED